MYPFPTQRAQPNERRETELVLVIPYLTDEEDVALFARASSDDFHTLFDTQKDFF